MAASNEEKGEKAPLDALRENIQQSDAPDEALSSSSSSYAANPNNLAFLQSEPGALRRIGFWFEAVRDVIAANWREDCERQNARFLWGMIALAFGVASYFVLPDEPSFWLIACAALGGITVCYQRARLGRSFFLLMLVTMWLVGLAAASHHGAYRSTPVLSHEMSAEIVGYLELIEPRNKSGRGEERWTIRVDSIAGLAPEETPQRLLLVRKSLGGAFDVGERLSMRARLMPLQRPIYPGAFDYGRYLWARAIGAQGYLSKNIRRLPALEGSSGKGAFARLALRVEHIRVSIARYLNDRIEGDVAGLAIALSVGKRDYLTDRVESGLRHSGLAHILAISGLHMALVTMTVFVAIRGSLTFIPAVALRFPIKQWAAGGALFCATVYLVLSGASVATIRAYFMTHVFLVAILAGRPALTMHNLALALLVVVFVQPYGVVEAGMQMSFAATAALIATYDRFSTLRAKRGVAGSLHTGRQTGLTSKGVRTVFWVGKWLIGIGSTSLIASIAVFPFSIVHFQQMAPMGLIANLSVMPIVVIVVMPLGLLSVLAVPFGLQSLPLAGVAWGLDHVISLATMFSDMTDSNYLVVQGGEHILPFFALGLAIFVIHRSWIAFAALAPIAIALIMWWSQPVPDVWISEKGNKVAIRDANQKWQLLGSSRLTVAYKAVLRSDGDSRVLLTGAKVFPQENALVPVQTPLSTFCDKSACFSDSLRSADGQMSDLSIALIRKPSAFAEECERRDIIVTSLKVPEHCSKPSLVFGRDTLSEQGARWLYFAEENQSSVGRFLATLFRWSYRDDGERPQIDAGDGAVTTNWQIKSVPAIPSGSRPWHFDHSRLEGSH